MADEPDTVWLSATDAATDAAIEAADAWWSLEQARCGDWTELESRVRFGEKLSRDERIFVADILAGKIMRKKHRNASFAVSSRQFSIAFNVVMSEVIDLEKALADAVDGAVPQLLPLAKRFKTEQAVAAAEQQFGVSRGYVFGALKKFRDDAEKYRDELLKCKSFAQIYSLCLARRMRRESP